jgi:hypothetical protein
MSIKSRKVALASAVFSMAVLASCGGGGGGSSSTTPPSTTPTPQPTPTTDAKVLAQTVSGGYAGSINKVQVCNLQSDGTISCGTDLNSSAETTFDYQYEFSNGNVLLTDSNKEAYYFDATPGAETLNKLTNGKSVDGTAVNTQLDLTGYNTNNPRDNNPNFIIYNNGSTDVVITKSGNYVQAIDPINNPISEFYMSDNSNFVVVTDNTNSKTYRIDASGNVVEIKDGTTSIEFQTLLAKVGDNILVQDSNNAVYLLKDNGTLVKIDGTTFSGAAQDAQMVKVGNDFYIAINDGSNNLYYYKNNTHYINNPVTLATGADVRYYALDGNGNVYYYDGTNVKVVKTDFSPPITGQPIPSGNFKGLIGTSAGAIADKDNNTLYLLTINNMASPPSSTNLDLNNATTTCLNAKSLYPVVQVNGESTSQIMCVDNSGNFSYITYSSGTYNGKSYTKSLNFGSSVSDVEVYGNNVVVYDNSTPKKTEICTLGSTNISCTDGLAVDTTKIVKQNNNLLAMYAGSSPYSLSIGDLLAGKSNTIFSNLLTKPTGGNVSADMTMAAAVYKPSNSPCANQIILYNNGTTNTYTSSNLCFGAKLLKLYK